jgi:cell division protein FtsB
VSAARSYHSCNVKDRKQRSSADTRSAGSSSTEEPSAGLDPANDPSAALDPSDPSDRVDLSGLSIAGITRRRVGWVAAGFLAIWIVAVFARQVGDATAATNRATQLAADNAALAAEVQALEAEASLIVEPDYVAQQARGHGFGSPREIPFTLDPTVAPPVDGAPGSASVRLGAEGTRQTPLESWLSLLFGPG